MRTRSIIILAVVALFLACVSGQLALAYGEGGADNAGKDKGAQVIELSAAAAGIWLACYFLLRIIDRVMGIS